MPRLALACLLLLPALPLPADIIDRVAVSFDRQVITESELREEIRIAAFLNGEQAEFTPQAKRAAAERLIDQRLIRREMDLTRYPQPTAADVADTLRQIKSRYGSDSEFQAALESYRITEARLEQALRRQAAVLTFIDLRFRPEVQVSEAELMTYLDQVCRPAMRARKATPEPTYDEARNACEEELRAKLVDERVEAWLKQTRSRFEIRYEEDAFQ